MAGSLKPSYRVSDKTKRFLLYFIALSCLSIYLLHPYVDVFWPVLFSVTAALYFSQSEYQPHWSSKNNKQFLQYFIPLSLLFIFLIQGHLHIFWPITLSFLLAWLFTQAKINLNKSKVGTNNSMVGVYVLSALLVIQLFVLLIFWYLTLQARNGASGTEYVGFGIFLYIQLPSFVFTVIYLANLSRVSPKFTKKALRYRVIMASLNILVFLAPFIVGAIVD